MPYLLPQRAHQERLSQGACCSGSRNTYTQCCHVTDDEASNEQIHEVKDEMVDPVCELLRVALANGIIVVRSC